MRGRLFTIVAMLLFGRALSAAASVVPVQGPEEAGVGFAIGDGRTLVTSAQLGAPISYADQALPLLIARRARGVSLYRLDQALDPLPLAESTMLGRAEEYRFLTPEAVAVQELRPTNDTARWQLTSEAWLAAAPAPVPPGSPLVRTRDNAVVGLAVAVADGRVVVALVEGIRMACFDAGVSAPTASAGAAMRPGRIIANWPFGGQTESESKLSDADLLAAWRDVLGLLPTSQTSLVASGSLLYFGDQQGRVYCVDADRRTLVWIQTLRLPVIFPPVVSGDTVYVSVFGFNLEVRENDFLRTIRHWYASGFSHLYAFDRYTGEIRWRHTAGLRPAPVVAGNRVYFGGLNGYGALDAQTGKPVWLGGDPIRRQEHPRWYLVGPPSDGVLPILGIEMRLYEGREFRALRVAGEVRLLLVEADTGKVRSTPKLGTMPTSDHPFAAACEFSLPEDHITFAVGKTARRYRVSDGALLWERSLPGSVVPGSLLTGSDLVLALDTPAVHCLRAESGSEKWQFTGLKAAPGALLQEDGAIYAGALDGRIYALKAATGDLAWDTECPGGRISGAPALVDGVLYAAASDGRLYALDAIGAAPATTSGP
jgi:outer membrane protein assembly factor BamB